MASPPALHERKRAALSGEMGILPVRCILLFATLTPAYAQTAYWPTGAGACPCIDPFSRGLTLNKHTPLPGAAAGCDMIRGDTHCYAATYGASSCDKWDWSSTPECAQLAVSSRPGWCSSMWCFGTPSLAVKVGLHTLPSPSALLASWQWIRVTAPASTSRARTSPTQNWTATPQPSRSVSRRAATWTSSPPLPQALPLSSK